MLLWYTPVMVVLLNSLLHVVTSLARDDAATIYASLTIVGIKWAPRTAEIRVRLQSHRWPHTSCVCIWYLHVMYKSTKRINREHKVGISKENIKRTYLYQKQKGCRWLFKTPCRPEYNITVFIYIAINYPSTIIVYANSVFRF